MGKSIQLDIASLGLVSGFLAESETPARGAVVVLQEIFGVNAHIRAVTERIAQAGFTALAPALFDPLEANVQLDYDDAGFARGRELAGALGFERALAIVQAAAMQLCSLDIRHVGVVGFCWGGSVAYLANTRLGLPAVSYYGARTVPFLAEALRAPMLFHFGQTDASIPAQDIDQHRAAHPQADVCVYPQAGHAFNRDVDPRHFDVASALLAWHRSLAFFEENLA